MLPLICNKERLNALSGNFGTMSANYDCEALMREQVVKPTRWTSSPSFYICTQGSFMKENRYFISMLCSYLSSFLEDRNCPITPWCFHYSPDVCRLCLQVIPALVHVIKSVLKQSSFLRVSQGFHHFLSVSINTFKDVIVGINFSLNVLKHQQEKFKHSSVSRQGESWL